jgi:ATP-binding cassette subfamily C (CFTR/MRP) protein 1
MLVIGMRIRTCLVASVYRKSLRLSNAARNESTTGEIVNLMAVDSQRFLEMTSFINLIWSAPLQIAISIFFLWQELGISVLGGLAIMIIMIPINGYLTSISKKLQIKQMKFKDERVKAMNEILNGIKVLKL